MNPTEPALLVKRLQAAGEPSRLRLLALCAEGALSVSDLALALKQSKPRVSRHLRILCEAGLIERLRQGQWVHYRLAGEADAASFVRGLLGQLDRRHPQLLKDAARARAAGAPDAQGTGYGAESRLGRALAGFATAGGLTAPLGTVLVVGVTHPELLERAALASRQCVALAPSRRAAQGARAFAERRGFERQLAGATVAVWGLTYKPGTDTLRRSSALELCNWLAGAGAYVRAHDPAARALPAGTPEAVALVADPLEAARSADALVVCTAWPQYALSPGSVESPAR